MSVTYPVRGDVYIAREWVRPAETRVCPVCNGRGWVVEPIRVFYHGKERREAAVTLDCYFCGGRRRVSRDEGGTK